MFSFVAIVCFVLGESCNSTKFLSEKWSFARRPHVYFRLVGVPVKLMTLPGSLEMKWSMCIRSLGLIMGMLYMVERVPFSAGLMWDFPYAQLW